MKKVIVSFLMAILASSVVYAADYRGFAEINGGFYRISGEKGGPDIGAYFSFNSTHGVQLNRSFFIGAGVDLGVDTYYFENPVSFSVFGNIRYDYDVTKKWSPFISLKAGYTIKPLKGDPTYINDNNGDSWDFETDLKPLYINPSIGVRLKINSKCGVNFGIGYIPLSFRKRHKDQHWVDYGEYVWDEYGVEVVPEDYHIKTKIAGAFTLNIGVDF